MKKFNFFALSALAVAFCIVLISTCNADDHVTANILTRVLALLNGNEQGTGFTIDVDGHQYIITAKHLVPGTNQVAVIGISHDDKWESLKVTILRSADADVAVLVPPHAVTRTLPIEIGTDGTYISQEVFFLGFPYDLFTEVAPDMNDGFPIPFVKRGTLSAWYKGQTKYPTILVDGINNPGFSGGPLVSMENGLKPQVFGVVTAYKTNLENVVTNNIDTGLKSIGNSGIIICYDIKYALDEIKKYQATVTYIQN